MFAGELYKEHHKVIPKEYRDFFKFTIVRNPYDRIVSVWWATTHRGQADGPIEPVPPLKRWAKGGKMIAILGNDISFENFCRHLPELGQSGTHCIHAQPQIDWIYPNMFDAIIPFEDLNEAWLSLPFNTSKDELKHINATARKENNNPISRQSVDYYLTPNTIKHINEFYADDFAILGYKKK